MFQKTIQQYFALKIFLNNSLKTFYRFLNQLFVNESKFIRLLEFRKNLYIKIIAPFILFSELYLPNASLFTFFKSYLIISSIAWFYLRLVVWYFFVITNQVTLLYINIGRMHWSKYRLQVYVAL